ncbi:VWA domain-containing protein [Blastopirellula marina]|uniref:VWFA domain-containing protein n=1 Tax=Blastopirellula marina TaxID=124 RepID=A0A2S8GA37_9BACT|nr:VWA domain-containing protein [Blastopirellula marina]PQO41141.1 hypothetical protein C5Y98_04080 [Blastopirellula marina]PTL46017.1 VWA domain-containing protein [Blastopirellula marina]
MSFALPTAFLLAAIALPIVGLYILKVRLRRVPVSTNLFWHQIFDEKPPRSIWQNLRHIVSLLMQLALLALLVLALADPYFAWQAKYARHVVLVIDNSASMQATDVSPIRFDAAIEKAQQLVTGLRDQDQVAIVVAGKSPEVVVGLTGHIPTLRRALDGIHVSDAATHLDRAIELGQQLVAPYERGEVIVLTDGCHGRVDPAEKPAEAPTEKSEEPTEEKDEKASNVVWEIFGTAANNVGITQFQTRRSLVDPIGYEILAAVHNASSEPIKARLEITLDDVPVDILPLKLAPGERWRRSLEKTSIEGGPLEARLTKIRRNVEDEATDAEQDASDDDLNFLTVDDVAYAILPQQKRQSVLLVTPGYFFLEKVFEANPMVDLTVLKEFPETWPANTVIVLHRNTPEKLPAGSVWVIDPENDTDLWTVQGMLENPIVTKQADDSPLMTHIALDNVLLPKASKLNWKASIIPLAEAVSGDAIYAEIDRPQGKVLVLGVNLESSDLAFRTAFPIMATNALSWFAGPSGELHPSISTDEMTKIELSEEIVSGHPSLTLISPTDEKVSQPVIPGTKSQEGATTSSPSTNIGPLETVGMWQLLPEQMEEEGSPESTDVEPIRAFAVNLASERETDLRPPSQLLDSSTAPLLTSSWWSRPPWFLLVCLACVLTAWEWFAYQRRVIT